MKSASIKTALLALSVIAGGAALPLAGALADTTADRGNATVAHGATRGVYDESDNFRDPSGRPISGWQYLVLPANNNG